MQIWKNAVLMTVLLAAACVAGCWNSAATPGPGAATGTDTAPGTETDFHGAPPKPFCEGWPAPKLLLVLSGEQNGYLEPCGCSATQSGGFARRADLFRQLQEEKKWPVVALDLGNTLKRSRRYDQIKFDFLLQGFRKMEYAALGLGPAELRLGPEQLLQHHLPDQDPSFLSANTVFFGEPDLGTPLPYRLVEKNGVKVGVISVIGKTYRDTVLPEKVEETDPINVYDAAESIQKTLDKHVTEKPDLLVLLSFCTTDNTEKLLEQFPQFDLAVSAGGPDDPAPAPRQVGSAKLILVGAKGKNVGLLGIYPEDSEQRLRFELVNLDKSRFKNAPSMEQLMADFQARLKDENLAANEKPIPTPNGAQFVGAAKCGECHTKAFAKWQGSKHAKAYDSLIKGRENYEGHWVSRIYDSECLACHVTGWQPQEVLPYESGFVSAEKTPHLLGQQCENCHGAGSEHTRLEEEWKQQKKRGTVSSDMQTWRQKLHLDQKLAQDKVCYQCHDGDNSPKFNFEKYFKEIVHPFRD